MRERTTHVQFLSGVLALSTHTHTHAHIGYRERIVLLGGVEGRVQVQEGVVVGTELFLERKSTQGGGRARKGKRRGETGLGVAIRYRIHKLRLLGLRRNIAHDTFGSDSFICLCWVHVPAPLTTCSSTCGSTQIFSTLVSTSTGYMFL